MGGAIPNAAQAAAAAAEKAKQAEKTRHAKVVAKQDKLKQLSKKQPKIMG